MARLWRNCTRGIAESESLMGIMYYQAGALEWVVQSEASWVDTGIMRGNLTALSTSIVYIRNLFLARQRPLYVQMYSLRLCQVLSH